LAHNIELFPRYTYLNPFSKVFFRRKQEKRVEWYFILLFASIKTTKFAQKGNFMFGTDFILP